MMMTKLGRSHEVNDFWLDFDGNYNAIRDIHTVDDSHDDLPRKDPMEFMMTWPAQLKQTPSLDPCHRFIPSKPHVQRQLTLEKEPQSIISTTSKTIPT